ncbi:MAG: chorismate-binding protein [Bacteroidales bacterium]|nr:chorismate-binding protein [Bacteroidales bacterium]
MQFNLVKLINLCLKKNIPFVSYSLPNDENIYTWIQRSGQFNFVEKIHEVIDKTGFVYAPFHRRTNFPIVFFEPELIFENENFEEPLIDAISERAPLYPEYAYEPPVEISKKKYLEQAETFIQSFDKDFSKAVLSRVHIEKKSADFNTGEFFMNLQKSYPKTFCHIINIPGAGTWAGASPETLLRVDENKAQTISLAGTQPIENINWSKKEIEEQKIVTDYIEDILDTFGIESFNKEKITNQQAGNLVHLATKFSFNKSYIKNNLAGFLAELHPTPAVCGLPKNMALDLILKTEKHNREYYAGYCGPINNQNKTDLFVNLRCTKILKNKLALFVGGGITVKSDSQKEWEESLLKTNTLLSVI